MSDSTFHVLQDILYKIFLLISKVPESPNAFVQQLWQQWEKDFLFSDKVWSISSGLLVRLKKPSTYYMFDPFMLGTIVVTKSNQRDLLESALKQLLHTAMIDSVHTIITWPLHAIPIDLVELAFCWVSNGQLVLQEPWVVEAAKSICQKLQLTYLESLTTKFTIGS